MVIMRSKNIAPDSLLNFSYSLVLGVKWFFLSYFWINVGNINSEINKNHLNFDPVQKQAGPRSLVDKRVDS